MISGRLEASRRAFEFYDLALTRHTDTHATYAVTATAGVRLPREALLAVSYRWREAWQVADDPTTCQFSADAGTTSCQADHLFLAPASSRRHQLETQLHLRVARTVGAEAFLTRDFWSHAWGLDVPVYFIARPDGGFTGGMVLTYDGARAHLDISVFVGQVFHFTK